MDDVLACALHHEPLRGFCPDEKCFFCGQCEDCLACADNVLVEDVPDAAVTMTRGIRTRAAHVAERVDSDVQRLGVFLAELQGTVGDVDEQMKDPEAFFGRVDAQLKKVVECLDGIPACNSIRLLRQTRQAVLQTIDVKDELRREIMGLDGWLTEMRRVGEDARQRHERQRHIVALMDAVQGLQLGETVMDEQTTLVLHVLLNTDLLDAAVQVPGLPGRPELLAPVAPAAGAPAGDAGASEPTPTARDMQLELRGLQLPKGVRRRLEAVATERDALRRELDALNAALADPVALVAARLGDMARRMMAMRRQIAHDPARAPALRLELEEVARARAAAIQFSPRPRAAHAPPKFSAFLGVEDWKHVARVRALDAQDVLGFRCTRALRVNGLPSGVIRSAALSSFGVLAMFKADRRELHLCDLVDASSVVVPGFSDDVLVTWHHDSVVAVVFSAGVIRRARYSDLRQRPVVATFTAFPAPRCTDWADLQNAQYTGLLTYVSGSQLVVVDLDSMRVLDGSVAAQNAVNMCSIVPDGVATLGATENEIFFVSGELRRGDAVRAYEGASDALLSCSEPRVLGNALVRVRHGWHVPTGTGFVSHEAFRAQTGWTGSCFVRLTAEEFLFRMDDGWHIVRVHVP